MQEVLSSTSIDSKSSSPKTGPDEKRVPPRFRLEAAFVEQYAKRKPNFGFNVLGEVVYRRSYSRLKEDGSSEKWHETVERVVNGCFNMQVSHFEEMGCAQLANLESMQREAQDMYERIFSFKFLPPGRGLWAMGTKITDQKKIYAALNNCAFVSTSYVADALFARPFAFLMDMSMLGVGVGFDTKGSGTIKVKQPAKEPAETYQIPDSREGWVGSTQRILESFFVEGRSDVECDYRQIRPSGQALKVFGGVSPGPQPLIALHAKIKEILESLVGRVITTRAIVDIMNMIGKCVISGNIRRSAEIAFGEPGDQEFLELKNYSLHPERAEFGWSSNNSVLATIGMDYRPCCELVRLNGEPGFAWLENMRSYGRMADAPDHRDSKAQGGNPCLE